LRKAAYAILGDALNHSEAEIVAKRMTVREVLYRGQQHHQRVMRRFPFCFSERRNKPIHSELFVCRIAAFEYAVRVCNQRVARFQNQLASLVLRSFNGTQQRATCVQQARPSIRAQQNGQEVSRITVGQLCRRRNRSAREMP
jgi:hypothetical protein